MQYQRKKWTWENIFDTQTLTRNLFRTLMAAEYRTTSLFYVTDIIQRTALQFYDSDYNMMACLDLETDMEVKIDTRNLWKSVGTQENFQKKVGYREYFPKGCIALYTSTQGGGHPRVVFPSLGAPLLQYSHVRPFPSPPHGPPLSPSLSYTHRCPRAHTRNCPSNSVRLGFRIFLILLHMGFVQRQCVCV